jgi:hypothetical protein
MRSEPSAQRTSSNGCLPFKANDHENKPHVGISRMRRFRMVYMCKGKRKLWLRGTDDVLVVGLHMVRKRVKVSSLNNVTSFLALLLLFFSFTWFIPLLPFLPLLFSLFILSFILSFSYFFSSFTFLLFFSFFPYSYFSLYFSLSWHLFKALNSSLCCMHTIWNFK